jgi:hypothetical protein
VVYAASSIRDPSLSGNSVFLPKKNLRVASLLVGLAVGIMSLLAMVRKWRGK